MCRVVKIVGQLGELIGTLRHPGSTDRKKQLPPHGWRHQEGSANAKKGGHTGAVTQA